MRVGYRAIHPRTEGGMAQAADMRKTFQMHHENPESRNVKHYTYRDCLNGSAPVPHGKNGSTLFQVLMVGGMVTFMVTINGLHNVGPAFFLQSHWLYPVIFCIAFLVRQFISSKLVEALAPKLVHDRLSGMRKALAMTVLNVCCTAPIMCALVILLLNGTDGFAMRYLCTLPLTAPLAVLVNYLVVGPIVKLLFNNCILPANGVGILDALRTNATPLARLLGFE